MAPNAITQSPHLPSESYISFSLSLVCIQFWLALLGSMNADISVMCFLGGFNRGKIPTPVPRTGSSVVDTGTGPTARCRTFIKGLSLHKA